ncbi:unnamed protein product [Paramecium octaurelia]|uniref:Uncharacterized protein n=1 Tax=Paramecium octaurelia TaxID=43137 RepID=A0A8S1YLA1_PAROT|nr:unnamed protein product [Paramecium octaurelia]
MNCFRSTKNIKESHQFHSAQVNLYQNNKKCRKMKTKYPIVYEIMNKNSINNRKVVSHLLLIKIAHMYQLLQEFNKNI